MITCWNAGKQLDDLRNYLLIRLGKCCCSHHQQFNLIKLRSLSGRSTQLRSKEKHTCYHVCTVPHHDPNTMRPSQPAPNSLLFHLWTPHRKDNTVPAKLPFPFSSLHFCRNHSRTPTLSVYPSLRPPPSIRRAQTDLSGTKAFATSASV